MFSESQGDLAKRPIPFSAPVQRTKPREPSQPVQESKENILAQIHIKLARKRELQAELDDLGRWAMDHPEGDWNDSARSYRVSMDAIDDEIEKLQSKL